MRVAAGFRPVGGEQCCDVTALRAEAVRPADPLSPGAFEVGYVTEDGLEHRLPLAEAWAIPFEQCAPVRRFSYRKGQLHLSGLWWSVTTGGHVGFESWLERDHVMLLDFDPAVIGIAFQPCVRSRREPKGQHSRH